jgi:hypothetical protein
MPPFLGLFANGGMIGVSMAESELHLTVSARSDVAVEFGEQLAWISSALHPTHSATKTYCTPYVKSLVQTGQSSTSVSLNVEISHTIAFSDNSSTIDPAAALTTNECWESLFYSPTVVKGYPIQRRLASETGLEMSLEIMIILAQARGVTEFQKRPFIKGFSTMLVPVKQLGDILLWHVLIDKEGGHISYTDERLITMLSNDNSCPCVDDLHLFRHVVGWCSRADNLIGMKYHIAAINMITDVV